jgi:hypothetical protein
LTGFSSASTSRWDEDAHTFLSYNKNITDIYFLNDAKYEEFTDNAFANCQNLLAVHNLPDTLVTINKRCFANAGDFNITKLPDSIKIID